MADRPEIEEARRRRAELIIEDVDDLENRGRNITAFQREARGVARDFLDLLGKQSEREKVEYEMYLLRFFGGETLTEKVAGFLAARGLEPHTLATNISEYEAALAPLPEQSEEEACPACKGEGNRAGEPCASCFGTGEA